MGIEKKAIRPAIFVLFSALIAAALLNSCDLFKPGLGDKVDITPPTVAITSPGAEHLREGHHDPDGHRGG